MRFDHYSVGDYVLLERAFRREDYLAFERLSGDSNPLHKDSAYGTASEFGANIVPMQLVASPLSTVAGMHFPGEPSLILGQDIRAIAPVFFDDRLTYSARIAAINPAHRVLTLSIRALRGIEIVLEGEMRVQSRLDEWSLEPSYIRATAPAALITGAAGGIGAAVARVLARKGWPLWLHARADTSAVRSLADECGELGSQVRVVVADLEQPDQRAHLANLLSEATAPTILVHTASPPLDVSLSRLAAVNYVALKEIGDAILPNALRRQEGAILSIGSTALESCPVGWDDYVAVKAMAVSYINAVNRRFRNHGVRGLVLAPGFVSTAYSAPWRREDDEALLPEEVAEAADQLLSAPDPSVSYVRMELGRRAAGTWGFSVLERTHADAPHASKSASLDQAVAPTRNDQEFAVTVRRLLRLPPDMAMSGAGLGRTAGWDSLRHIELILGIERAYRISFTSDEIEHTRDFENLSKLWERKVGR